MKPVAEKGIPISQSDPSFPASVEETLKTRLTQIQARLDASSSVEERPDGFSYVPEFIQLSQAKDDLAFLVAALLASETQHEEAERERWTCFHCGETFTTYGAARDHFGAGLEAEAGCLIDRVAVEEGGKPERGRGLLIALRTAENEIHRLRSANELLDHEACGYHTLSSEINRLTNGHGLRMELDYRDGEKIVLQERVAELEAQLLASETQQQWQPIETAPKDGDWFLGGWWSPSVFEGEEEHPWFEWNRCRWADYEDERGGYFYSASGGIPTHWLPLSSPPASEKG